MCEYCKLLEHLNCANINLKKRKFEELTPISPRCATYEHGDIILNRSNNLQISIETSAPQQARGFIINNHFGISNITTCR